MFRPSQGNTGRPCLKKEKQKTHAHGGGGVTKTLFSLLHWQLSYLMQDKLPSPCQSLSGGILRNSSLREAEIIGVEIQKDMPVKTVFPLDNNGSVLSGPVESV